MIRKNDGKKETAGTQPGRLPGLPVLVSYTLVMLGILAGPASAFTTPDSIVAAGKLYVSNVTWNPQVFFTGDSGTVTFEVTNGASDQGIAVNHATLVTNQNIRLTSPSYDYSSNIGPNEAKKFIFTVSAVGNPGYYYPAFSLGLRDADNLWQISMVEVDNTPLELTLHNKPDTFSPGRKDTIDVQLANPRYNPVRNVVLELSGDGADISPARVFIGSMGPGDSRILTPTIIPSKATSVTMKLMYDNGDNPHETTTVFPVAFDTNKKHADPVISNVVTTNSGGVFHVTGDVTNAGLETANGVTVTSLPPARPEDPFRTYVVGALKPDDFASFDLTFGSDTVQQVPLQISYKDADGNIFSATQDVNLEISGSVTGSTSTAQPSNDSSAVHMMVIYVLIGIVIVVVVVIVAMRAYGRRQTRRSE